MAKKAQAKKTTKNFLDKLEYWKRGALIGLLVGILFNSYVYSLKGGNYIAEGVASWQALPNILPLILYSFSFSSTINNPATFTSMLYIVLWYIILGSIVGIIYKFIKQKYPKNFKIIFTVALIIFIILVLSLNFLILMLLLARAG